MNITISYYLLLLFLLFDYVKTQIYYDDDTTTETASIRHSDDIVTAAIKLNLEAINITSFNQTNKNLIQTNYNYSNNNNKHDKLQNLSNKILTDNASRLINIQNDGNYEFRNENIKQNESRKFKQNNFNQKGSKRPTILDIALQSAAKQGLEAMLKLYDKIEPDILRKGHLLDSNHPAAILSKFSSPTDENDKLSKGAFATLMATKSFQKSYKFESADLGRQATTTKISFRRTALEGLCPQRESPICLPAAQRYRTHDGTCNNPRRPRWGSAQMPFNRFLPPEYGDGIDSIRRSLDGGTLSSARFVSLLVHGAREGDAPVTLILAQWGQLIDHDLTSTAQPRSINGSIPRCCGPNDFHPACFPIKVPLDDPWLSPLKIRCLEFLRSAPAQRRDCVLSWREQTNQVTSYLDASPVYSSNARTSDNARVFHNGLLLFGRGDPSEDVCHRGAMNTQCIRPGDPRSSEQPGLLALHHVWVGEHNRIASELSLLNQHWSDEKVYQETRRIIGALFQHITFREFLPLVLGREVCRLFDLDLLNSGYYTGYDTHINPTVANSFSAAAFRFGHSLVQGTYLRCDRNHNFINNNVTLHEEFSKGDIGSAGSLHRLLRGMAAQRALNRDEFISAELTNHLFQSGSFPFGLDLAAINIQRGRDHGIPPYTTWREPCGLAPIHNWDDMISIVGPESSQRIRHAYASVHDIDLFVGGIAERPVVGGLVGPTFACIIAQQFSNLRRGDRFWYENSGFESSFTPAQLQSIRRVSLAQVLCRATSGGTIQPHVFIPHEADGNQRLPCGFGPLIQMDLLPWQEQDPFKSAQDRIDTGPLPNTEIETETETRPQLNTTNDKDSKSNIFISRIDFIPNGSTGFHRPPDFTKIHDKLDFVAGLSTKRPPTHIRNKPTATVNNKLDTKKTRKPSIIQATKPSTTKRTVIINNIAIEIGRTVTAKPETNKTLTTNVQKQLISTNSRVQRESFPDFVLLSVNNKSVNFASKNITYNNEIIPTTPKCTTSKPLELRNYYEQDVPYPRPQNILIDGLAPNQQYDIEINIRQTNKNKNQQQPPRTFNYNKPFDYTDMSPIRNDYSTIQTTPSPFSYRPQPTRKHQSHYELQNIYGPQSTTKPPKIIYIKDDILTTSRPNFFQNLFSFGNTNTNKNNAIANGNDRIDVYGKPNKNGNTDGHLISGIHSGQQYGFNSGNNNIGSSNTETSFTINIRPSLAPSPNFIGYPTIDSRPVYGVAPVRHSSNPSTFNNYGFSNSPASSSTNSLYEPHYSLSESSPFSTTTVRPYYNRGEIYNYKQTTYRPKHYRPFDYTPDTTNIYPEHKELQTEIGRSELNVTTTTIATSTTMTWSKVIPKSGYKMNITNSTKTFDSLNEKELDKDYDYYDDDENNTDGNNKNMDKQYDRDGYLRPEHMFLDLIKTNTDTNNMTKNNIKTVDDNFIIPALIKTDSLTKPLTSNWNLTTKYTDTIPRRKLTDISSTVDEDYDETNITELSNIKQDIRLPRPNLKPIFVPINIINKSERSDNWVIFDTLVEKPPLPKSPELNSDANSSTKEFPKPMTRNKRKWRTIFWKLGF